MAEAVGVFVVKARRFFYSVMLLAHRCPKCSGHLMMIAEGRCECQKCKNEYDPTITFQRCSNCGGRPILKVRRYTCSQCGSDIQSLFLFDGLVYDRNYFKAKMTESRHRKQELKERVRLMLSESRSEALDLESAHDLDSVAGLVAALNSLTADLPVDLPVNMKGQFDLNRYQTHIESHIKDFYVSLTDIPPLIENARKDLIWRFIAVIFLTHTGVIEVVQKNNIIKVKKHVANSEGQGFFEQTQDNDGLEGLAC